MVRRSFDRFALAVALVALTTTATASAQELRSSATIERNPSAATGRAGSATLQARALLSADGTTVIEMTTGALDSDETPPGYFAKVQIKGFNDAGEVAWARNVVPETQSGYLALPFPTMLVGQAYQVQANIRGIDGNRTNVVTVSDTVKRRPDLAVTELVAPQSADVGLPVNVLGTVTELNGDVGASAECVLYVDGVEADRASNIWVAAGTSVACAFVVEFETAGVRELTIAVQNVVPANDIIDNDSLTASIEILDEPPLSGTYQAYFRTAQFIDRHYSEGTSVLDWKDDDFFVDVQVQETRSEIESYSAHHNGHILVQAPGEWVSFPTEVQASLTVDGASTHVVTHTAAEPNTFIDVPGMMSWQAAMHEDPATGQTVLAVSVDYDTDFAAANGLPEGEGAVYVQLTGLRSTYLSDQYLKNYYFYQDGTVDVYVGESHIFNVAQQEGGPVIYAQQEVQWSLQVQSASGVSLDQTVTVPLQETVDWTIHEPLHPFSYTEDTEGWYSHREGVIERMLGQTTHEGLVTGTF